MTRNSFETQELGIPSKPKMLGLVPPTTTDWVWSLSGLRLQAGVEDVGIKPFSENTFTAARSSFSLVFRTSSPECSLSSYALVYQRFLRASNPLHATACTHYHHASGPRVRAASVNG
jgi:hypothetical protein